MARVWIVGAYGHGNFGDDMLGWLALQELSRGSRECVVMAEAAIGTAQVVSQGRLTALRNFRRGDVLVIAGGGLFDDEFGRGYLWYFTSLIAIARLRGLRVYIVSVGVEMLRTRRSRALAGVAFALSQFASTRDAASSTRLPRCVRKKVRVVDDIGWLASIHLVGDKRRSGRECRLLAVSIAAEGASSRERVKFLQRGVSELVGRLQFEAVDAVVMQRSSVPVDDDATQLADALAGIPAASVPMPSDGFWRAADQVSRAGLVVSYRLHGAVLAYCSGCPVVVVSRADKTVQAFAGLPGARVVSGDASSDSGDLLTAAASILSSGETPDRTLVAERAARVRAVFEEIINA